MKLFIALAAALAIVGCQDSGTTAEPPVGTTSPTTSTTAGGASTATTAGSGTATTPPPAPAPMEYTPPEKRMPKDGEDVAVMETSMGKIVLMFFPDKAPKHVKNFKDLSKKGFYD